MTQKGPIRLAIVGCSRVVQDGHGPALAADPRFSVDAVVDPIPERTQRIGTDLCVPPDSWFSDHWSLDSLRIDAALVATPPHVRREIIVDLVSRGIDIVSEKPLATTLDDADTIIAAVSAHDRTLVMVHNYPFIDEYVKIAKDLEQGRIGVLRTLIFRALGSPGRAGATEYDPQWRWNATVSGGGRMLDLGIHALNLANEFLGEPCLSVTAEIVREAHSVEDRCFAAYRYESGVAVCEIGSGHGSAGVEIIGSKGRITLDYPPLLGSFSVSPLRETLVENGEAHVTSLEKRDQFPSAFYDHVYAKLAEAGSTGDGHDGRLLIEMVHAAYLSADRGRSVMLPLDTDTPLYKQGVSAIWD